ncbi:hypothetical protein Sjap_001221 [Stephania japonica]|uniref:IQ domain-containing protein IQM3 n=1 Tax=Stephania japonica TaxID=461633 RepID=A0AAP0KJJ7_9MAGN
MIEAMETILVKMPRWTLCGIWPMASATLATTRGFRLALISEFSTRSRSSSMRTDSEEVKAAVTVQKFYRSHRIRRRLADSAFVGDLCTISYFNYLKPETVTKRWNRVSLNASRVAEFNFQAKRAYLQCPSAFATIFWQIGKGLSEETNARKLAFQHWIEAIDPRHRYGHNLNLYHEVWRKGDSAQPFFYWLDVGHGRAIDLKECSRSKLQEQRIKYLGPKEREHLEYVINDGKILHKKTEHPMDTTTESQSEKWIYVMDTSKKLYAGQKKKGAFHHSSFLAGGSTLAAGSITAVDGVLKGPGGTRESISAYSGHYRPTTENLNSLLDFLTENGIDLDEVEVTDSPNENDKDENHDSDLQDSDVANAKDPDLNIMKFLMMIQRIDSKKATNSYQLGHQLSKKWTTGAGPRIGCLTDYPAQLREEVLEFLKLSPRLPMNL